VTMAATILRVRSLGRGTNAYSVRTFPTHDALLGAHTLHGFVVNLGDGWVAQPAGVTIDPATAPRHLNRAAAVRSLTA